MIAELHIKFDSDEMKIMEACYPWVWTVRQVNDDDLLYWSRVENIDPMEYVNTNKKGKDKKISIQDVAFRWASKVHNGAMSGLSKTKLEVCYGLWSLILDAAHARHAAFSSYLENAPRSSDNFIVTPKRACELMIESSAEAARNINDLLLLLMKATECKK